MNDWLLREIATGIQKLLFARLSGAPAADMVEGTVLAWGEALRANRRQWNEKRDVPRLREAFAALLAQCDEWPAPRALLEALPSSYAPEGFPLLAKPELTPAEIEARRRHAAKIIAEANRRADAEIARERRA